MTSHRVVLELMGYAIVDLVKALSYKPEGLGVRSRWPRCLRRGSAVANRLLGLRVRIPPEAWIFLLYVLHSKDKKQNAAESRRGNKYG